MPLTVTVGWPDKALWSNGGHGHWGPKHRATKAAKEEAFWATRSVMGATYGPSVTELPHDGKTRLPIHLIARPKTGNAVDEQNLVSGLKAHFDGISNAIGIDDKFFKAPTVEWGEPKRGGEIQITIEVEAA